MAAIRQADAIWQGELVSGKGVVTASTSGAFTELPVTWASRAKPSSDGRTSPEELIAAAHCFSMALFAGLGGLGAPLERFEVSAKVTFEAVDGSFKVAYSALTARDGCPVSQALKGNVKLSVEAILEP